MDKTEMTLNEYARLAQRTSNQKAASDKLENGCLGLAGEAGEVCDVLKKYLYRGTSWTRPGWPTNWATCCGMWLRRRPGWA